MADVRTVLAVRSLLKAQLPVSFSASIDSRPGGTVLSRRPLERIGDFSPLIRFALSDIVHHQYGAKMDQQMGALGQGTGRDMELERRNQVQARRQAEKLALPSLLVHWQLSVVVQMRLRVLWGGMGPQGGGGTYAQ